MTIDDAFNLLVNTGWLTLAAAFAVVGSLMLYVAVGTAWQVLTGRTSRRDPSDGPRPPAVA
jgi:hypothetical protein